MSLNNLPGEKSPGPTPADVPIEALPTVELTTAQMVRAEEIAQSRNDSYASINGGRVCGNQSSTDAHLTGVVGELAYALHYDESIDTEIYEYGDGGYDFSPGSLKIDTKTTATYINRPSLIVPVEPSPRADLYFFLHRIEERKVRIIGFATRATVVDQTPIRKPGDDLNFVVPQSDLRLPPDVYNSLEEVGNYR